MNAERIRILTLDFEELTSRGVAHPDGNTIIGRIKVVLGQLAADVGEPPPPADPVDQQLQRLNLAIAALAEQVAPITQRQHDVAAEIGIVSAGIARLSELVTADTAATADLATQVGKLATRP